MSLQHKLIVSFGMAVGGVVEWKNPNYFCTTMYSTTIYVESKHSSLTRKTFDVIVTTRPPTRH